MRTSPSRNPRSVDVLISPERNPRLGQRASIQATVGLLVIDESTASATGARLAPDYAAWPGARLPPGRAGPRLHGHGQRPGGGRCRRAVGRGPWRSVRARPRFQPRAGSPICPRGPSAWRGYHRGARHGGTGIVRSPSPTPSGWRYGCAAGASVPRTPAPLSPASACGRGPPQQRCEGPRAVRWAWVTTSPTSARRHYQDRSLIAHQQVGRAGRAGRGWCCFRPRDADQDYFIRTAFPREQAEQVITLLEDAAAVKTLSSRPLSTCAARFEGCFKIRDAEGGRRTARRGSALPVGLRRRRAPAGHRCPAGAGWRPATAPTACLFALPARRADDPVDVDCGCCSVCRTEAPPARPRASIDLVSPPAPSCARHLSIEPRRQWPRDVEMVSGNIPWDRRALDGRALGAGRPAGATREAGPSGGRALRRPSGDRWSGHQRTAVPRRRGSRSCPERARSRPS
jgi:hypothetical protein